MAEKSGFSLSSVVMSYFLVAGGSILAILLAVLLKLKGGAGLFYGMWGVGALFGGFVAGRASQGQTVLEPAIGSVLVAATLVGLLMATDVGKFLWDVDPAGMKKYGAILGGTMLGGGLVGAFISEKLMGESTTSQWPWIAYVGIAAMGAVFMACLVGFVMFGRKAGLTDEQVQNHKFIGILVGMAGGSLLTGLAAGASARVRIIGPTFLGSLVGFMGFSMLLYKTVMAVSGGEASMSHDDKGAAFTGLAILAVGAAIVAIIGTAIGWAAFGKKNAAAS